MIGHAACPTDADLRRLIDGSAPEREACLLTAHLDNCEGCRLRLDRLAGGGPWDALRALADRGEGAASSLPAATIAVHNNHSGPVPCPPAVARARKRKGGWPWMAVVIGLLAVVTAIVVIHIRATRGELVKEASEEAATGAPAGTMAD